MHVSIYKRHVQLHVGKLAPGIRDVGNLATYCFSIVRYVFQASTGRASVHYDDGIMGAMASQITSLTIVYSTVYSDADEIKHQSSASLAFVRGIHWDRWIPRTNGQLRGKCLHLMTSSWITTVTHLQQFQGNCHHSELFTIILCFWEL